MKYLIRPKGYYQNVDEKLSHAGCVKPFKYFEAFTSGLTCACCSNWLPVETGSVLTDTIPELFENFHRKYL